MIAELEAKLAERDQEISALVKYGVIQRPK